MAAPDCEDSIQLGHTGHILMVVDADDSLLIVGKWPNEYPPLT